MSTSNLKFLRKIRNKTKRASNGNIKNFIKIIGWNKAGFFLGSKISEIKQIIKEKNRIS